MARKTDELPDADETMLLEDYPTWRVFAVIVTAVVGLGWMTYLYLNSPGVPVHDELGHFFMCRDAWKTPRLILNRWGRVANTLMFMPGAHFGLNYARLSAIVMSLGTFALTMLLAHQLKVRNWLLVPLFLWFQPWFADLSYTAVTEVPFMLFMVGGTCLFLGGRYALSALIIGLLPLTRHEGIALVGLLSAFLLVRKQWVPAILAWVPLVVYNAVSYAVLGQFVSASLLSSPKPTEFYGQGGWAHFFPDLAKSIGIPIGFLAANAFIPVVRSSRRAQVFVFYLAYLGMHVVIYRFGLFASGGYVLFLLPIAPAVAVAAALGLDFLLAQGGRVVAGISDKPKVRVAARGTFVIVLVLAILLLGFETRPRELDADGKLMKQVAAWIKMNGLDRNPIVQTHGWLHFFLLDSTERPTNVGDLDRYPKGTILVWDYRYSERRGAHLKTLQSQPQTWRPVQVFARGRAVVFQKIRD